MKCDANNRGWADPTKHARSKSLRDEPNAGFASAADNGTLGEPAAHGLPQHHDSTNTTRHRAHVMTVSRSQDGFSRSSHDRSHDDARASGGKTSPPITAPLLMPPPTTLSEDIRHRILVSWLQAKTVVAANGDLIVAFTRLVLFLAKVVILARPCWPYVAKLTIGAPLVGLAGIDLALPAGRAVTSRGRGGPGRHEAAAASRWVWDIRTSLSLFFLHVLAVWLASMSGGLCAKHVDQWSEW
jgi:hypothetical protein